MTATVLQRSLPGEGTNRLRDRLPELESEQSEVVGVRSDCGNTSHGARPRPFVSVVVPHYNNPTGLVMLLERLEQQTYPHDRFECILVDNGSDEAPGELPSTTFAVRQSEERRPGSYSARNRGLELARGDVIAFTDSDCLPTPEWIEMGVETMQRHDEPVVVGGRIQLISDRPENPGIVELYNMATTFWQAHYVERLGFAATANVIAPRAVVELVGNFDATLLSGGDREWCFRVGRAGIPLVYDDRAIVQHPTITRWAKLLQRCQRISGGDYELQVRAGKGIPRICLDQWGILCRRIRKLGADPRWGAWRHFPKLVLMEFAIRILHVGECVRLRFGGKPQRI